ncbi:MAG: hemerythrin domain-containing protein [Blastocatellia bacterium]|nr:hemerythrin domain-containing protein [Blastocatellia bacterium]MCS7158050.1 hemerythrin domain-containing protein [Blastocatellia bacterium]MDW8257347.1 hemerythrin domain-containing protein [Acidobacteriota bacterium]
MPDIGQEIREEHEKLTALMRQLQEEIATFCSSWASLREGLRAFKDHLRRHFELEEEGGFMEEVLRRWPHATPQVEALRAEHERLLQETEALLQVSRHVAEDQPIDAWAAACGRLLSAIQEHEWRENRLIQEVFCLDVGGGD